MAIEPRNRRLGRTRQELSEFLIRHRQKLTPATVGLPNSGRRRTPGLRREEVAALAGVGLTWYTWFEQGRDIQVSEKFLLSLAYALKLDDAECCHLFLLAHKRPPPVEAHQCVSITQHIQQLLDELCRPAYILNLRWDVIAWNASADDLFGFSQHQRDTCNFLRLIFTDPALRSLPDWQTDALRLLAQFRYDFAVTPEDPAMLTLIEDLKVLSSNFRLGWEAPNREVAQRGIGAVRTTDGQHIHFHHETLVVDEHRHLRMIVYFAVQ